MVLATCSSLFPPSRLRLRQSDFGRLSNLTSALAASSHAVAFPSSYGSYYSIWIRKDRRPTATVPVKVITPSSEPTVTETETNLTASLASEVVRSFYEGINRRDLSSVEELIASDCVYEDLIFAQPFVGRKSGREGLFPSAKDAVSIGWSRSKETYKLFMGETVLNLQSSLGSLLWYVEVEELSLHEISVHTYIHHYYYYDCKVLLM